MWISSESSYVPQISLISPNFSNPWDYMILGEKPEINPSVPFSFSSWLTLISLIPLIFPKIFQVLFWSPGFFLKILNILIFCLLIFPKFSRISLDLPDIDKDYFDISGFFLDRTSLILLKRFLNSNDLFYFFL